MAKKYQCFNGLKFTRDEKTGYYLNSTNRIRLHRYVWGFHNGKIPKGYCVHHIDHDKSNNDISNLKLIPLSEHSSLHGNEYAGNHYKEMCKNLDKNARPKANEWHSSPKGLEWHKKHYEITKDSMHTFQDYICENCGCSFQSTQTRSRFCSNKCKSAYRRKSELDNEIGICKQCGKEFSVNRYKKTKFCSRECASKARRIVETKEKNCAVCGKSFTTKKDKEKDVCSIACSNRYRAMKKSQ